MSSKTGKLLQFINYRCVRAEFASFSATIGCQPARTPLQTLRPPYPAAG